VLEQLVQRGVLAVAPAGTQDAFLPARDLDAVTVKSIIDALKGTSGPVDVPARTRVDHRIDRIFAALDQEMKDSRNNATMRSLAIAVAREEAEEKLAAGQGQPGTGEEPCIQPSRAGGAGT